VPENAVIAVAVASLIPRKRVDFMIRGFATAKTDAENAMLLVIGDGAERQSLESLVSELELGETVRFLGLRNDVEEILSAGDIFVHSAIAEACSYAILESMASEIPAVVTESGAAREQILDGKTGYVLSRDDMDGFASRLTELLQDEALRKRMGEQARARWQECYRVDLASKKYHALYRSMVRSD
jgi:glycosyltransferase involved in cell wall biosynthesis